jgi:phage terminase large subunit
MEMSVTKASSEIRYLEVWEGHTKQVLEGAIYAEELLQVLKENRKGVVKYNPSKPVFTCWDLGHSDKTAIWFVQKIGLEYNLIDYHQDRLKKMPHYIKVLQDKGYNYSTMYLPHDGDAETLSNVTPKKQLQDVGFTVRIVERPSKKAVGINAARSIFPLCNFDEAKTADGWQCLQRYAYKVLENGAFSKEPEHDTPWSHGADGFQTLALSLKSEQETKKGKKESDSINLITGRSTGWMGNL